MSERMRVVDGVADLPKGLWDDLVHGQPTLRFDVLKAIGDAASTPLHLQSFTLEDDAGLAAAALCEVMTAAGSRNRLDSLLFGRATRVAQLFGMSSRPALLFMTPLGTGSSVIARRADVTEQRGLLHRLLDGIEERAAACRLGVAFIGIPADDDLLIDALRRRAYLESLSSPTTRLDIEWPDFDGYVRYLRQRSKGAAQTARTERKRNLVSGVRISRVERPNIDPHAVSLLARAHFRHKNGFDSLEGPQFLPQLLDAVGDDFLVFEAERDAQRVAALGVLRSGPVGWVSWLGFRERDRPNDFTYANLCFYHLADCAQALGLKTLLYGNSALQAKRIRGCRVITNRLFYLPAGKLGRFLVRPYLRFHRSWYRRKLR